MIHINKYSVDYVDFDISPFLNIITCFPGRNTVLQHQLQRSNCEPHWGCQGNVHTLWSGVNTGSGETHAHGLPAILNTNTAFIVTQWRNMVSPRRISDQQWDPIWNTSRASLMTYFNRLCCPACRMRSQQDPEMWWSVPFTCAWLYMSFLWFCLVCVYSPQFSILFWIMYLLYHFGYLPIIKFELC